MARLETMVLLSVLWTAMPGAATRASGCTVDADCENGDVCSVPDRCVGGACVLGGGGDANADLICDGELNPDAEIEVNKIVAKKAANIGRVRGTGSFIDLGSAGGAFTGEDGISIRVKDTLSSLPPPGDGIDNTFTFAPETCHPTTRDGVTCQDPITKSSVKFVRNPRAVSQISFFFRIRGVLLTRPFFGPVQIVLTHNGQTHRRDVLTDCKLYVWGIKCREF